MERSAGWGAVIPKHVFWVSLSRLNPLRKPDKAASLSLSLSQSLPLSLSRLSFSSSTSLMTLVWFSRQLASLLSFWRCLGFISAVCSLIELANSWAFVGFHPFFFPSCTYRSRTERWEGIHKARRSQVDGVGTGGRGCTCAHPPGAARIFF